MCNLDKQLEKKPIPPEGIGWKLVRRGGKSLIFGDPFSNIVDGYFTWNLEPYQEGFMFFETREEAERARDWWNYDGRGYSIAHIKKIRYREEICSLELTDHSFGKGVRAMVAKQFKWEEEER